MNGDDRGREWSTPAQYPVAHVERMWVPGDVGEGDHFRRRGHLDAARLLIHTCDDRAGRHLLLPALGCYRHYFELQLKELARIGRAIRTDAGHDRRGHRLEVADLTATLVHVNVVDGRTEQHAKTHASRDLADLRAAVDELNRLDPRAVAFRYAYHVDDSGTRTPTVAEGFWLDLPATVAVLEAGVAIAEGADTYLDVWRSNYADYLADMADLESEYADYSDLMGDQRW